MDAYLSASLIAAVLITLVLDGSLLDDSVAAALQFVAKALACMPLRMGDFQFIQSYFDCNLGLVKKVLHHARH